MTVLKPLGDKSSAGTRKLPAAAFTRMSSLPKCLRVDSTARVASPLFRTSPSIPTAGMPREWREATAESSTCLRRPMIATEAPCNPN
uniref:Peroxisomal 2 4-dienoyl-CoA reductase-like n=1 Tax=Rhizophora mucronata TaxID=61149 RepID=A0A2P2PIF4_RHIMU